MNYRPISLLNNDYKIGACVLAAKLKNFLVKNINEEQAGFLPAHQIKGNPRFFLNAVEYFYKNPDKEVSFFFVNAEKAFDNLN